MQLGTSPNSEYPHGEFKLDVLICSVDLQKFHQGQVDQQKAVLIESDFCVSCAL